MRKYIIKFGNSKIKVQADNYQISQNGKDLFLLKETGEKGFWAIPYKRIGIFKNFDYIIEDNE